MKYTIETDSHGRRWLKEEGYGYIAQVAPPHLRKKGTMAFRPVNKGVDMSDDELKAALIAALGEYAQ